MPPRPPVKPPVTPGQRFKTEIENARAAGTELSGHVLQLTYGDFAKLRRDPAIPDEDIDYTGGGMRYLGVRVIEGGTASSALIPEPPAPEPEPAPAPAAAKPRKKKTVKSVSEEA